MFYINTLVRHQSLHVTVILDEQLHYWTNINEPVHCRVREKVQLTNTLYISTSVIVDFYILLTKMVYINTLVSLHSLDVTD